MSNKKLKEKKKKAKEVATAKDKLNKKLLKIKKEKRARQLELESSPPNAKLRPYRKTEDTKYKIERNLQILKALEEEHNITQQRREEMNRRLEEQGHLTFEDKLNAINANSEEIIHKEKMSWEESAEHFNDVQEALEEVKEKNNSENIDSELKSVASADDI